MKPFLKIFAGIILLVLIISPPTLADDFFGLKKKTWKPVPDNIFLQEAGQKIPLDKPATSLAVLNHQCYVVVEGKVHLISEESLKVVSGGPENVTRLKTLNDVLWALTANGIYRFNENNWQLMDEKVYVDVCLHLGTLHAATREEVYRLENDKFVDIKPETGYLSSDITMVMEDGSQVLADPVRIGPIDRIDSYSGTLHILRPGKLVLFDGRIVNQDFVDWGTLPSPNTFDMLSAGSRLFVSTNRGLGVLRGAALTSLKGKDGLPYEETTCLETGFDNDIWIGTTKGAIRMLDDDWHYFGADHWLPGDNVHDIAVGNNVVYIATDHGIGIIRYEPYTLRKKADYYERHLDEWGHKRMGFIHTLYKKGDEWIREVSDNDGAHTAPYLAAMSFKYAVTGDKSAREEAVESFKAMLWLQEVTTIDGLIARSIWSTTADADTRGKHGSGGLPARWYPTDDGKWYWKGDTSSDEIIAHFYSVSIFHDLVAEGKEKEMAKKHLAKVAEYIYKNGWVLIDMDGTPTRWGRWDPKYLLSPYGYSDKGLNGLEASTFMKTAHALTGESIFEEGFEQLMDFGYQNYIVRQKNTFPPENIAPWDDNLAFESYYSLLRYTKDPMLRSIYLRSLERTFEVKRMEHIGWFNFSYGAITGNDCEVDRAAKSLREWTLDCIEYNYRNSFRDDLYPEPGYVSYEGGTKAMSPRETSVTRGSRNALGYDGGANGRRIMEPTGYLRDYWMARYHGMIEAPQTMEEDLLSVPRRKNENLGAKPYDGPKRPKVY
ncbi:MAG: hypothetical protein QNK30_12270 [Bacteroidales bacterium]|nr:hypothetical protein [Bacteroidales bacterium]